jgi:pseudaminic acid synthase
MAPSITIAGRAIGQSHPPYIICELSANHNGRIERALDLIEAAAATGADAIKIQTYTPDTLTIAHDAPEFRIRGGLWDGYTLYDLYREAYTPYEWHPALVQRAKELGVTMFSTPFDESAVKLLSSLAMPAYKIASFEIVDLQLIECVARQKKPMIISTGMANHEEIAEAVETARRHGAEELVLLHCVSTYPARFEQANLRTIPDLARSFGVVAGLSDHTPGTACAVAAVAVGACVIEKHFTLRRADGGPDAAFSLEPDEFKRLVEDCRAAWSSLGRASYERSEAERESLVFRRSLYVVKDVAAGEELTSSNIRSIRPGYGMPPKHLPDVLGRCAARPLKRGEPLRWQDIAR